MTAPKIVALMLLAGIALKLAGVVTASWWWVLTPVFGYLVGTVIAGAVIAYRRGLYK